MVVVRALTAIYNSSVADGGGGRALREPLDVGIAALLAWGFKIPMSLSTASGLNIFCAWLS